MTRNLRYILPLILCLLAHYSAVAHEIHLKSGGVIKTDIIERSGSHLSYEQFGGMVTIPLSEV